MKTSPTLALFFFLLACASLQGQIELVKNINAIQDFGSGPKKFTPVDSILFFSANDGLNGAGLWRTDGTLNGTYFIKRVSISDNGTFHKPLVNFNGTLYFIAYNPDHGSELWRSDGTETGTFLLGDLNAGYATGMQLIVADTVLFFEVNTQVYGSSIWRVMGDQISFVANAASLGVSGDFTVLGAFQNKLIFRAGGSLWITDGTAAGTITLYSDLDQVTTADNTVMQGVFYFRGSTDYSDDYEIWRTDGTPAGTYRLKDIWPGSGSSFPVEFTVFENAVYFIARDSLHGFELWRSDGTAAGTVPVYDILPGVDPASFPNLIELFVFQNKLIYIFEDGVNSQWWQSDGTSTGTNFLTEIPGHPDRLAVSDDFIFFRGTGAQPYTSGLWRTDGTSTGTIFLDLEPGPVNPELEDLTIFKNRAVFSAGTYLHGREVWTSDGTQDGTTELRDINTYSIGSFPYSLVPAPGRIYFTANDGISGPELWQSDGTEPGTFLTADLTPGIYSHNDLEPLGVVGNSLYFKDDHGIDTLRIWRTDGANASVILLDTFWDSFFPGYPGRVWFMPVMDKAVFVKKTNSGSRLYSTTATPGNTVQLADISIAGPLVPRQDFGFFWSAGNRQLWRTDGMPAGTSQVFNFAANNNLTPGQVAPFGNNGIIFISRDSLLGRELWVSDGTTSGTQMIKDITPGSPGTSMSQFTTLENNLVLFGVYTPSQNSLWRTDGTETGTMQLAGFNDKVLYNLTAAGSELFFLVQVEFGQFEIWKSDGSISGTVKVTDTEFPYFEGDDEDPPGPVIGETKGIGQTFFFTPLSSDGVELWQSDGTAGGTFQVADLRPGPASSKPHFLTELDGRLYFVAEAGIPLGGGSPVDELWRTSTIYVGTKRPSSSQTDDLQIAPNPCQDYFRLSNAQPGTYVLQLTDALGKVVYCQQQYLPEGRVGVEGLDHLPPGAYFLLLSDLERGTRISGRVAKR